MGGGQASKKEGTDLDQVAVDETAVLFGMTEVFSLVPRIWPQPTEGKTTQRT